MQGTKFGWRWGEYPRSPEREGTDLFVDAKTRRDLELFRTRSGTQGVVDLLDLAVTSGGSRALRARFESPSSDPVFIRQVQDTLRFLLTEDLSFPAPPPLVEEVTRYRESSWDVGSNRRGLGYLLDVVVVRLRYRELLRFAREGVKATGLLFEHLVPFLEDLLSDGGEEILIILRPGEVDFPGFHPPASGQARAGLSPDHLGPPPGSAPAEDLQGDIPSAHGVPVRSGRGAGDGGGDEAVRIGIS